MPTQKQIGYYCHLMHSTKLDVELFNKVVDGVQKAGVEAMRFAEKLSHDEISDLIECLETFIRTNSFPENDYIVERTKVLKQKYAVS